MLQLYSPLDSCTVEQLYGCTVVQLNSGMHSCTLVQLRRCTVVQLYSYTVAQSYSSTVFRKNYRRPLPRRSRSDHGWLDPRRFREVGPPDRELLVLSHQHPLPISNAKHFSLKRVIDSGLDGVPREQKLLKGHLPRVIYHQGF